MITINPIRSIARLTIRTGVRSRACTWLLAATLGITLGLPLALHGDGTAVGHIRMVITYPLGILFAILLLGTLWMSTGLIALEISNRQLQSISVKPISTFEIWAGKWLGLLVINSVLIIVATLGMLLSVTITARHYSKAPKEYAALQNQVLTGRRAIIPQTPPYLIQEAEHLRWVKVRAGEATQNVPIDRFLQELKIKEAIVSPGTSRSWSVTLPSNGRKHGSNAKRSLQFHFRCSPTERAPISGIWTLASERCIPITLTVTNILDGVHCLAIPGDFAPTQNTITITFAYKSTETAPHLFFDADAPVALLLHESPFILNLLRGMLAMLSILAAVAAIGLTMGALFSFPVAVFAGASTLLSLTLAAGFSKAPAHHGHEESANAIVTQFEQILLMIKHSTTTLANAFPITALGNGMLFSWQQTAESVILLLLILPLILGTVSALLLSQKELAA